MFLQAAVQTQDLVNCPSCCWGEMFSILYLFFENLDASELIRAFHSPQFVTFYGHCGTLPETPEKMSHETGTFKGLVISFLSNPT